MSVCNLHCRPMSKYHQFIFTTAYFAHEFKKNIIKTHSLEGTHGELRPKYTSVFTCTQGPRTVSVTQISSPE